MRSENWIDPQTLAAATAPVTFHCDTDVLQANFQNTFHVDANVFNLEVFWKLTCLTGRMCCENWIDSETLVPAGPVIFHYDTGVFHANFQNTFQDDTSVFFAS